jgi:diketogulonate reductase-like aldo/keto reductase
VHTPRLFAGKIREGWQSIIALQKSGQAKAIGVSNFTLDDMKELLEGGEKGPEIEPAANQIELHLYNWHEQKANVEYCQAKVSIVKLLPATLTYLLSRASLSSLIRP